MLRATCAQMVAPDQLLCLPELSQLQESGQSSEATATRTPGLPGGVTDSPCGVRSESARIIFKEAFYPPTSGYSGVLADSQNHRFRLRLVRVSGQSGFIHCLSGYDLFTRGRGF